MTAPPLAGNPVIVRPSELKSPPGLAMAEDLARISPPGVSQIVPGADHDLVVEGIAGGMNCTWPGQSCGSTSRLLGQRDVHDEVVARVGEKLADLRTGAPQYCGITSGGLVCRAQLDEVRITSTSASPKERG